jgi:hypothetical protein
LPFPDDPAGQPACRPCTKGDFLLLALWQSIGKYAFVLLLKNAIQ